MWENRDPERGGGPGLRGLQDSGGAEGMWRNREKLVQEYWESSGGSVKGMVA